MPLALLLVGLHAAGAALAQAPASAPPSGGGLLRGEVVRDGEPVPGVEVTLHRVLRGASGPLATEVTDASGRFRFALPPADTSFVVLFTTAEYQSVRYFGRAIHPGGVEDDYRVEVYDTASALPFPIRISRRDMVLVAQAGGGWQAEEVIRLHNPNDLTLVSPGTSPSLDLRIPQGVEAFEVGESEIPAEAVRRMDDRILLLVPLTPGEREMFFRYQIPPSVSEAVLPLNIPADTFNLFVRQPAPQLEIAGLTSTEMIEVEGERFLRYAAVGLAAGSQVSLAWETSAPPIDPVIAAVVLTVLLLAAAAVVAARSSRGADPEREDDPATARSLAAGHAR